MPVQSAPLSDGDELVIKAWNLMGGLEWAALDLVCAILGVEDPEWLIRQLVAMRNHQNAKLDNG